MHALDTYETLNMQRSEWADDIQRSSKTKTSLAVIISCPKSFIIHPNEWKITLEQDRLESGTYYDVRKNEFFGILRLTEEQHHELTSGNTTLNQLVQAVLRDS